MGIAVKQMQSSFVLWLSTCYTARPSLHLDLSGSSRRSCLPCKASTHCNYLCYVYPAYKTYHLHHVHALSFLLRPQVEVAGRGDLQMLDCSITVTVPTPEGALYPQPSKNCGALLVEEGARATVDRTEFSSSPLGYGVVARDPGTRVRQLYLHMPQSTFVRLHTQTQSFRAQNQVLENGSAVDCQNTQTQVQAHVLTLGYIFP